MRFSMLFPLLVPALVAAPALAAPAPLWNINKANSKIAFAASMNGGPINGSFRRFDTRIAFDPSNLAGSSVVAVIDTGSASTGDATRDEALPSEDWFSAKAFPRATFKASQFKPLGKDRYLAIGTLGIRGATRPVSLPFQLSIAGKEAHMQGSLTIDRRWFGVGQGQFAGTDAVAANVRIDLTIDAQRQ